MLGRNGAGKTTLFNCISEELPLDSGIISLKDDNEAYKNIKSYSFSMKNKIQMLCYLITKPDIILLNEPLTSFDVVVALEIKNLLKEIKKDHILIFSTHILQLAVDLCDELVILKDGQLYQLVI